MNRTRRRSALPPAAAAVALWSTVAVAFKLALRETQPADLAALASFVSWAALGMALLFRRLATGAWTAARREGGGEAEEPPWKGRGSAVRLFLLSALVGLLNPVLYYAILFAAYDRLPAQVAQPLNYTWPVFLALLAAPMAGRRPTVREFVGLVFGFAGVVVISWRPESGVEKFDPAGMALALGSGLVWSFYWLVGAKLRVDGLVRLFVGFGAALIVLVPFWLLRGAPLPSGAVSRAAVVWVGLFEMGVTFLLWNTAMSRTSRPARLGSLAYVGPFVSLVWIALVLGETIRPTSVAALAIIIAGVLIGRGGTRRTSADIARE